jgi:hypothetical protein
MKRLFKLLFFACGGLGLFRSPIQEALHRHSTSAVWPEETSGGML